MQELQYFRPETLDEALELLDRQGKYIRVLAGGTDLIVALRDRVVSCGYLMDIKAVKELKGISYTDGTGLRIGAAVCLNDLITSDPVVRHFPLLAEAAGTLANSLLRNRATLVGNICNASPGGDMLSPTNVLEGKVEIASVNGRRTMELEEFILGVKKTALKENELVTGIFYPVIKGKGMYLRRSRIKGHDLAQVSVAAFLKDGGGLKLSVGAAGPVPVVVRGFEKYKASDIQSNKQEILKKVLGEIKPISDQRASKEYRTDMVEYLTMQILNELGKEMQL